MSAMQDRDWTFVDKAEWGPGPWQSEPDKRQWTDPDTGLPCLLVRGPGGHLCGYVGVPADHPWYEKDYDAVDVEVHGGLTFADHCSPGEPEHGICHIVEPGEDDRPWWLGFGCAHLGDLSPKWARPHERDHSDQRDRYRSAQYVANECASLARQVREAA